MNLTPFSLALSCNPWAYILRQSDSFIYWHDKENISALKGSKSAIKRCNNAPRREYENEIVAVTKKDEHDRKVGNALMSVTIRQPVYLDCPAMNTSAVEHLVTDS